MTALFEPLRIRGVTIPNRIGLSPMCTYSAHDDGLATSWHLVHLGSRAMGGVGLVFTEATAVSPEGRITNGDIGIWDDAQAAALEPIAAVVREAGSVPGIQLSHAGRKGGRTVPWTGYDVIPRDEWGPLHAPSPIPFREDWQKPDEMDVAAIAAVIEDFRAAARRSVDAGFAVIELHFAHGYLVHQFLSPLSNHRIGAYGGSLRGRARLAVEIAAAVRAEAGPDTALFARLSVVDWMAGGLTLDDSVEISMLLREAGVDVIDCSSGAVVPGEAVPVAEHYLVPFAEEIRARAGVPTAAVGLIRDPVAADRLVSDGRADIVLVGRALLRDAYWARQAAVALSDHDALPALPVPYRRAVLRMDRVTQW